MKKIQDEIDSKFDDLRNEAEINMNRIKDEIHKCSLIDLQISYVKEDNGILIKINFAATDKYVNCETVKSILLHDLEKLIKEKFGENLVNFSYKEGNDCVYKSNYSLRMINAVAIIKSIDKQNFQEKIQSNYYQTHSDEFRKDLFKENGIEVVESETKVSTTSERNKYEKIEKAYEIAFNKGSFNEIKNAFEEMLELINN